MLLSSVLIWLKIRREVKMITTNRVESSPDKQDWTAGEAVPHRWQAQARQLNAVLCVQALTPFLLQLVPIVLFILCLSVNDNRKSPVLSVSVLLFSWSPCIDALSTILIVAPYRRAVFSLFSGGRGEQA